MQGFVGKGPVIIYNWGLGPKIKLLGKEIVLVGKSWVTRDVRGW